MLVSRSSGDGDTLQAALQHITLYPRADNSTSESKSSGMSSSTKTAVIVAAIVVIVLIILVLGLFIAARYFRVRNASPKYIPTQTLKNRWRSWTSKSRGQYSDRLQPDPSVPSLRPTGRSARASRSASPALEELRTRDTSRSRSTTIGASVDRDVEAGTRGTPADNQTAVDRHTSVRSVMTLPAYTPSARETEQILGREGERGGIDVVLEYPETQDDVEARREEEMESLYQIRRARRAEAAEREERRRLRREARARGDWSEVERLRLEARERQQRQERQLLGEDPVGQDRTAARLIAEHQEETARRERQRRVSSVQYAELGVARHDGSRVRASSNASARSEDARPLLDSAASLGGDASSRRGTLNTIDTLSVHHRNHSTGSVFSLSSNGTDDEDGGSMYHPPFAPPPDAIGASSRGRSGTTGTQNSSPDFEVVSLHSTADNTPGRSTTPRPHSRTASASRLSHSISANNVPPRISISDGESPDLSRSQTSPDTMETPVDNPPHYEHLAANEFGEPPNYESPVRARAPQLPALNRLPSIRVEETVSPVRGPSSASAQRRNDSGDMGERRL